MRVSASQRGISWVGYFAALVAVTACSIGVWVLSSDARREIDALAVANADSMQWLLAQAEVEHLIFANALLSADPEDLTSLRDVRTRFDVFYSRISLLDSSRNFVDVRADPEVHAALARITTFLNDTVPLIDGPAEELAAALESLCEEVKALREDLRTISLAGVRVFAEDSETQRSRVANALLDLAILAILLFLGLIGVVLALMRSLAEGQRRTSEIRAAQSHLRSIVTTSLDGILVVDQNGVVLDFNGAAERIFGYAPEEAIGQSLAELIVPEHLRAAHHAGMNRYLSTGKKRVIDAGLVQLEAVDKSGRLFPVEMSLSTAESEDGEIFVSYIRDISERVQAEQELVEARDRALAGEKAKASLLAVMSHEMRTPLNGILGSLQLIAETKLTDKQRDYVQVMDSSGRLLLNHVNTVLDISRTDAGKTQAAREPFDPGALLEEVAEGQRVQAEARKNRIEVAEEARAIGVVQGDPVRLQQVLINLVANAVKFTRNGTITLEAERLEGDLVHFRVTDTGIGIAEENLDRIFEDFVTLDTSYRREVEGTGLGLGIVRRLVGVMGGEIGVESCLGEGTIFWMDIPLPAMRGALSPIAEAEATASQDPVATDLSVLLVEDNEINRMVAREMLQGLGCAVSEAVDGLAGVERAEERAFDLILMDISMPRLDGIAATERIRAGNGPNARTPIVALTAHALPGEVDRFREAGMSDAVVKPISKDRLRELLASLAPATSGSDPEEEDAAAALIELLGADRARTIIGKAHAELSDALDELREMAGREALHDDIRALSHKMAGTSALIGLTDLRAIFIDIERAAENEDLAAVEQGLDVAGIQFLADRARMDEMLGLEGIGAA